MESTTCTACLEPAGDSRVPSKCGHNALCGACYDKMCKVRRGKEPDCPLCRGKYGAVSRRTMNEIIQCAIPLMLDEPRFRAYLLLRYRISRNNRAAEFHRVMHDVVEHECMLAVRERKRRLCLTPVVPPERLESLIQAVIAGTYDDSEDEAAYGPPETWDLTEATTLVIPAAFLRQLPTNRMRWKVSVSKCTDFRIVFPGGHEQVLIGGDDDDDEEN